MKHSKTWNGTSCWRWSLKSIYDSVGAKSRHRKTVQKTSCTFMHQPRKRNEKPISSNCPRPFHSRGMRSNILQIQLTFPWGKTNILGKYECMQGGCLISHCMAPSTMQREWKLHTAAAVMFSTGLYYCSTLSPCSKADLC